MIDSTRAFRPHGELKNPSVVTLCERNLWNRLVQLQDRDIEEQLGSYLDTFEMSSLLKRRRKLVKHLEELIERKGEDLVIYSSDKSE
jgi:hypothetical protein